MRLGTISVCAVAMFAACVCSAQPYFVSPSDNDANPGTLRPKGDAGEITLSVGANGLKATTIVVKTR